MSDRVWVYAEVVDEKISRTSLEMLSKAAEVGEAEAILLGPAPADAVQTLATYGARKIYRAADPVFRDYLTLPLSRAARRPPPPPPPRAAAPRAARGAPAAAPPAPHPPRPPRRGHPPPPDPPQDRGDRLRAGG